MNTNRELKNTIGNLLKPSRRQRRYKTPRQFNNSGKTSIFTTRTGSLTVEKYKQVLQRVGNKTIVHLVKC